MASSTPECKRSRHQRVWRALNSFNARLLTDTCCYFGGGTRIVLGLGEYRESADVDFLCADGSGYRRLRNTISQNSLGDILTEPIALLREVRADRYGIRTFLDLDGEPVKFEIITEGRILIDPDPAAGLPVPARTMSDFWSMLAHYHGQIWNGSEIGRAFGVSHTAVRRYLDLLSSTFMVRQLRPWTRNSGKRIVKSPKIYIADSGLLHSLLGVATPQDLAAHPKVGASFEGFALEQVLRRLEIPPDDAWYWATPGGAELDLLLLRGSRRFGFEFKRTDAPKRTRSMLAALEALQLERLDVIYPGARAYRMHDQIRAVPLASLTDEEEELKALVAGFPDVELY